MNILIIGAGGFIGSHLSEFIVSNKKDWKISAIDICDEKINHLKQESNFKYINANVLKDREVIEAEVEKCDLVLPLAAIANPSVYVQDPLRVFELDFESNLMVIKLAAKYKKRVIFPSTSEVYGMCSDECFDEETSNCVTGPINKQRWIYSCSKQMLDRVIYAYGQRDDLSYTLFRPFNWIGPRLDNIKNADKGTSRVLTQFLSSIFYGKDINLVDGGEQQRCFIDISDCINALMMIIENKNNVADREILNIGNPDNMCSIKDLAHKLVDFSSDYDQLKENAKKIKILSTNHADYYGKSYQDVQRRTPSIAKMTRLFGWLPSVSLDLSLRRVMDFYFR